MDNFSIAWCKKSGGFKVKKFIVLFFLVLIISPDLSFSEEDAVLAKIGNSTITMTDFNRMISYYDAAKQKALAENPAFKATILQRIIQGKVVSMIAKDAGFSDRPDIKEQIELMSNDIITAAYLKKEVVDKINVTEEDMKNYYTAHKEEFEGPETVRVGFILIGLDRSASDEDKKKAREKAEDILKRVKAGEDFGKLAAEFSDDPATKQRGGDFGVVTWRKEMPKFEKAIFSLPQGGGSDLFESSFGYYIIKAEARQKGKAESFDNSRAKIKEKIIAEFAQSKVKEFVMNAMEKAGVEINLQALQPKQ